MINISELIGKTLTEANQIYNGEQDKILFTTSEGRKYEMYHEQDCCESVTIEDVVGDYADLLGTPILTASEDSNWDGDKDGYAESVTWTYYRLSTIKGSVSIRWYGTSNGYYSESVSFREIAQPVNEALVAEIKTWEANAKVTKLTDFNDPYSRGELCALFYEDHCEKCPVAVRTGKAYCVATAITDINTYRKRDDITTVRDLSREHVTFLTSLLPKDEETKP